MLRSTKSTQRQIRILAFRVTGTGTAAINQGSTDATLTDNGTGDYTLTFNSPGQRLIAAVATSETDSLYATAVATTSTVRVKLTSDAGTATDGIFHAIVMLSDVA